VGEINPGMGGKEARENEREKSELDRGSGQGPREI